MQLEEPYFAQQFPKFFSRVQTSASSTDGDKGKCAKRRFPAPANQSKMVPVRGITIPLLMT